MKLGGILILFALFAAGQAGAQSLANAPSGSATITVAKPTLHWFAPVTTTKPEVDLKPVEGLDPRAWTTVAGGYPDESVFVTAETHRSKLRFLSMDF
jgi:hypothetical protein